MDVDGLRSHLDAHGQSHLLQFWEGLSEDEKQMLFDELKLIDLEKVSQYFKDADATLRVSAEKIDDHLETLPPEVCGSVRGSSPADIVKYRKRGLTEVGNSRVGVLLLAGGQGTRLGVPYPKGMYDVGLPSGKTLYQLQAERILRLQRLAQEETGQVCHIPWYIMTSEHTKEATQTFFQKHQFFGLQPDNVVIFEQGLLPCLTFEGKIILETPGRLALAPDGNGGLYRALKAEGMLEDMARRGTQYIHVYCVDNILVKMADPVFVGFCVEKNAECGAKVVEKTAPQEAVGVVCKVNGRYQVVEYSEITLPTAEKRAADGRLAFRAGNICNHFFTLDFLRHVCHETQERQLKHHVAKKKIPHVDAEGRTVKPQSPNGIKMEKFVFDVFQFARNFAVWDVVREEEFSPLKNADGAAKDTPTTCRHDLLALHQLFAKAAGALFVHADGSPYSGAHSQLNGGDAGQELNSAEDAVVCEISPLLSYAGEGLDSVKGQKLCPPVLLDRSEDNSLQVVQLYP
ncbi:UDP-N-acetylhexosamine pyrophosphorylase-like [Babylonia areolata]|uniref:UDP-N-acetylhexosamine pyrophosphorylase-like n=1 Tax=Babylonia areolata TaxID=304850 RepID=UPI003FD03F38